MANFLNLLFRASDGTAPITPVHRDLFGNGFISSYHSAPSEGSAFDSSHHLWTVGLVSPVSRAHRDLFLHPGCCSCHSRTIVANGLSSFVAFLRPFPSLQEFFPCSSHEMSLFDLALLKCIGCSLPFLLFLSIRIPVVVSMTLKGHLQYCSS